MLLSFLGLKNLDPALQEIEGPTLCQLNVSRERLSLQNIKMFHLFLVPRLKLGSTTLTPSC